MFFSIVRNNGTNLTDVCHVDKRNLKNRTIMWFKEYSVEDVNNLCLNTMVSALDIKITEVTPSSLVGSMPVSNKVRQPFGIVHGGANCVLAETLGSLAANMTLDGSRFHAVGLSINTSHIKAVRNGVVKAVAHNIHKGKTTQIWEIKTYNDNEQLTSTSTLTMAIIEKLGN
jgi:1,4-dihydroxy-2-naphthoyl-CoA hydrolase